GRQCLINVILRGHVVVDDVLVLRNMDGRRWQIDERRRETNAAGTIKGPIIEYGDFTAVAHPPIAAQGAPFGIHLGKHLRSIAGAEAEDGGVALPPAMRSAHTAGKTLVVVMPNEGAVVVFDNGPVVGFANDGTLSLVALLPLSLHLTQPCRWKLHARPGLTLAACGPPLVLTDGALLGSSLRGPSLAR